MILYYAFSLIRIHFKHFEIHSGLIWGHFGWINKLEYAYLMIYIISIKTRSCNLLMQKEKPYKKTSTLVYINLILD